MAKLKLKFDLAYIVNNMKVEKPVKSAFLKVIANTEVKREIGKTIIDRILERTNEGIDKKGRAFKKYSKEYVKSDIFKIYGKNKGQVNLKLTGEMQAAIDVIKIESTAITIGFVDENEENKAMGHIDGANYLPVRDFWGLPVEDVQDIIKKAIKDFNLDDQEFIDAIEEMPKAEFKSITPAGLSDLQEEVEE